MLDQHTIKIIKSTVPVLKTQGEAITKKFYNLLFTNHPELLNIFNHANQKQGRQQAALANAVYAAAAHIDHLEEILGSVKQISHKHRSLGIKPEHYPIVGENLLKAIQEVLGLDESSDIIQAWGKAYGEIANAFIGIEKEMYQQAEQQKGGWEGFKDFKVVKKVKESDVITSFYLKPVDGGAIASFQPGQYISVKIKNPEETYTQIRQYSLSDAPGRDYYRISVKREDTNPEKPKGKVSVYLHEKVEEGDVIPISAPSGDFVLDLEHERPIVLLSGGVGLTPMMSMLTTIAEQHKDRKVTFIQAAINGELHAMKETVAKMTNENENVNAYVCYETPTEEDRNEKSFDKEGYVDLKWLKSILETKDADFYFCGPVPFMNAVNTALKQWGVEDAHIHFEFFGPSMALESEREEVTA